MNADILISVCALALSVYAVFRNRIPGPTGPAGPSGSSTTEPAKASLVKRPTEDRPKFLTMEQRRKLISDRAYDPEILKKTEELRRRRSESSALIPPDMMVHTDHAAWRARYTKD